MRTIDRVDIGDGHQWSVEVDDTGRIVRQQCKGRWPMTAVEYLDAWQRATLQNAVSAMLDSEG